jgi:uncharacterized membrane protein
MATVPSRAVINHSHRILWVGMLSLCAIAIAAVVHRMVVLAYPLHNVPPEVAALDGAFAQKPFLTLAHIVPALVFVLLVPLQFSSALRARHTALHRWIGRVLMTLAGIIGVSAFCLIRHPVGGIVEVTAILFYDGLFLFAMTKALWHIRRGQVTLHREWIIRGISVALGVATVRPIMGIFFAMSRLTGLTPHDFFGIAFWIGFTVTYVFAELWIRRTRQSLANASS